MYGKQLRSKSNPTGNGTDAGNCALYLEGTFGTGGSR